MLLLLLLLLLHHIRIDPYHDRTDSVALTSNIFKILSSNHVSQLPKLLTKYITIVLATYAAAAAAATATPPSH